MFVLLWIVQCYENGHLLVIFVNMSFALLWDVVMTSVMCIEKEWEIKEDVPFRGMYRAPRWLLLPRVMSCAATDAWTDMSPMGSWLRDSGCVLLGQICIIILAIAFHCIAHTCLSWTLYCVLMILWMPFCGIGDWWVPSLLLRLYNLLKYCCWGYVIC